MSYGDIDGLEKCIKSYMDNSLSTKSPSQCNDFVKLMYTKEKMVEKYHRTYEV